MLASFYIIKSLITLTKSYRYKSAVISNNNCIFAIYITDNTHIFRWKQNRHTLTRKPTRRH